MWKATVVLSNKEWKVHTSEQRLDTIISTAGDLSIVRVHPDMYAEPTIAAYAAHYWRECIIEEIE